MSVFCGANAAGPCVEMGNRKYQQHFCANLRGCDVSHQCGCGHQWTTKASQAPDTTPAALAQRAADELAQGGYEVAQAVALVAIAGALAAKIDAPTSKIDAAPPVSIRQAEPGGYLAGIRAGLRRAAGAAATIAIQHESNSHTAAVLNRFADALECESTGEIRLDKDRP